jgi:hypothetical protein
MTTTNIAPSPFGVLAAGQGQVHKHGPAGTRLAPYNLPEKQSSAELGEGFWQGRAVVGPPPIDPREAWTLRAAFWPTRVIWGRCAATYRRTNIAHYSNRLLFERGFGESVRTNVSTTLDADVPPFFPILPETAFHGVTLVPETLKLQEFLATRLPNTSILGESILHSFDVLSGISSAVGKATAAVFASGSEEVLEDGVESSFARDLEALLRAHGHSALLAVEDLIRAPETNKELAFEATRMLGSVDDAKSHDLRRKFLEELLDSAVARLRHAAASGLAAMDDPASLSAIERAAVKESNGLLRKYLARVADQLLRRK